MADTGYKAPSTLAEDTSTGALSWVDPQNGKAEDGSVATCQDDYQARDTYYLKVTNFSANVPTGATINGISVGVKKAYSGSAGTNVRDKSLKMVRGGTISGDEKGDTTSQWPAYQTLNWVYYGGTTDKWGLSWTAGDGSGAGDVNSTTFGAAFSAHCQGGARPGILGIAWVDSIQIKIYYTTAASITGQVILMSE